MWPQFFLVTSVRGIALDPIPAASGPLGVIAFMKAAFGLRFLPLLFFAFFFAISISPLNDFGAYVDRFCGRYGLAVTRRCTISRRNVNAFPRENGLVCSSVRIQPRRIAHRSNDEILMGGT